ncbi:hypothetical protein GALL_229250 [mine drainage metagenome]|uniref:Periplasmic protein n=1 Tax=mine drainage metagenome TaxID=410659 RepID=A0A1J5S446_9ZZZZ
MSRFLKVSAILMVALVPLASASAQGYGNGPMGPGAGMMGAGRGMMGPGRFLVDPARLPALKTKLAITGAQEPLWTAYANQVSTLWETRQAMRQSMQGQSMTWAERQEMRKSHQAAGADLRANLQKARNDLSAVLTPQQRSIFDQEAPPMPMNGMPR